MAHALQLCADMPIRSIQYLLLVATFAMAPFVSASAGTLNAVINGKSYHVGATREWNENNYGLGIEYQFDSASRWKTSAMANGLRDSENEMSYMIGGSLQRRLLNLDRLAGFYVDAGITAFVMTRQDVNDNRPFPGILPTISLGTRHVGFNMTYLPMSGIGAFTRLQAVDPGLKGIFYVQMKVNLGRLLR